MKLFGNIMADHFDRITPHQSKSHEGIKVKRHKQLVTDANAKTCTRPATLTNATHHYQNEQSNLPLP